jgi:hypothetical protein
MSVRSSAPLLSRVKSWQLISLGFSGWILIYGTSIVCRGVTSPASGHLQGGCFAAAMALAGVEARRYRKPKAKPADPFAWTSTVSNDQINQAVMQIAHEKNYRVEAPHPIEADMGFGVRAVNSGRTWVFETSRWNERVINLTHAMATEENRKKIHADVAVIVSAGTPDADTQFFAKKHPVLFIVGDEIKNRIPIEIPPAENAEDKAVAPDKTV